MELERARRVMETTSADVANQYLRFGWKMIGQYVFRPREDQPERIHYVLASIRSLEDTKQLITLHDTERANAYLQLGWRLVEKFVSRAGPDDVRDERLHLVLAWSNEEPPEHPTEANSSNPE